MRLLAVLPKHRPLNVANTELPPVLLFQATGDAATPYEGAVTLHRLLAHSSLVVEQGGGNHGVTLSGNSCLDKHLSAYLTDGTVPRGRAGAADAVCERTPEPKPEKADDKKGAAAAGSPGDPRANGTSRGSLLHRLVGFRG